MDAGTSGYRGLPEQRPELELLPVSRTVSPSPEATEGRAPTLLTRLRWAWRDGAKGLQVRHANTQRQAIIIGACACLLVAVAFVVGLVTSTAGQQASAAFFDKFTNGSSTAACTFQQGSLTQLAAHVASPLGYSLLLHFHHGHFLADDRAAVQEGFSGWANITIAVHKASSCIALHASGLNFSRVAAALQQAGAGPHTCLCGPDPGCTSSSCNTTITSAGVPGVVLVHLGEVTAPAGSTLLLQFAYTAQFGNDSGLWRSKPFDVAPQQLDGAAKQAAAVKEVLLTTQFEATAARTVLPCFDEPSFKAPFAVAVDVPPGLTVLSNGALQSVGPSPAGHGHVRHTFEPSPVMSSYLLAVAAGHMTARSALSTSGKNVSVWSIPGREAQSSMALAAALAAVSHYEAVTGIVLPLPKFDLVAVPGKAGAMENFGLLIFDDDRLLFDAASKGAWDLWRCADVVCHEMGHQWFGNLVTAHTWADLTVNEGAASFHEYACLAAAYPQMTPQLLMGHALTPLGQHVGVHEGIQHNARLAGQDPTAAAVLPPSAPATFGGVTYAVGASLLAMMSNALGADAASAGSSAFQSAMQTYLRTHAFSTATTKQLFDAVAASLPANLVPLNGDRSSAVDAWLQQPGYPLLLLDDSTDGAGTTQAAYQQRRFCSWGLLPDTLLQQLAPDSITAPSPDSLQCPGSEQNPAASWWLPLAFAPALGSPAADTTWLVADEAQGVLALPDAAKDASAWLLQGAGAHGMFRVRHSAKHRRALREAVAKLGSPSDTTLPGDAAALPVRVLREAAAVVDDQLTLALSPFGELPGREVLDVLWAAARSEAALGSSSGRYALLLPVLEAVGILGDRLQHRRDCWLKLQAFTATMLEPHAVAIIAQLTGNLSTAGHSPTATGLPQKETPEAFFGRLLEGKLLLTAALAGGQQAARFLCEAFVQYTDAAVVAAAGGMGRGFRAWLDPDLRDAAFAAAAAKPAGCDLGALTAGQDVWGGLAATAALANAALEPATASRALFALTHSRDMQLGDATLSAVVLGGSHGQIPQAMQLLNWTAPAAPDLAIVLARSAQWAEPEANGADGATSHAMALLEKVVQGMQQAEGVLGHAAAWDVVDRLAAASVSTQEQWQALAQQLLKAQAASKGATGAGMPAQQASSLVQRVLSHAWSSVAWAQQNADALCEGLASAG